MKKILIALMALVTVSLVACNKDDKEADNSANDGRLAKTTWKFETQGDITDLRASKDGQDVTLQGIINFINEGYVNVQLSFTNNEDGLMYNISSVTTTYSFNGSNGFFTLVRDGESVTIPFSYADGILNLLPGTSRMIRTGSVPANAIREASDVLHNTYWTLDPTANSSVYTDAHQFIEGATFTIDFYGNEGNGVMHLLHDLMPAVMANGINVPVTYTSEIMPSFNRNFGTMSISVDASNPLSSAVANYIPSIEYVYVNEHTLVLHMYIADQLATMIGLDEDIDDIFVPMIAVTRPEPTNDTTDDPTSADNVTMTNTVWTIQGGTFGNGTITFNENTGVFSAMVSVPGIGETTIGGEFTYTVNGRQVSMTPSGDLQMYLGRNPINVSVSNDGTQISFNAQGTDVIANLVRGNNPVTGAPAVAK